MKNDIPVILAVKTILQCSQASAQDLKIFDGDSFVYQDKEYRLWGIDAPEYEQTCKKLDLSIPCGQISKAVLSSFIGQSKLDCITKDIDHYGRKVAVCTSEAGELNALMVKTGWAVEYKRYSKNSYASQQQYAQQHKLGIWTTDFELPHKYRRNNR